jgi:hypothetical protein
MAVPTATPSRGKREVFETVITERWSGPRKQLRPLGSGRAQGFVTGISFVPLSSP